MQRTDRSRQRIRFRLSIHIRAQSLRIRIVRLFQQIRQQLNCEPIEIGQALVYNSAALNSAQEPAGRKRFWAAYQDGFPADAVAQLSRRTFLQRVKRYLSRLKRKIMS